MSKDPKQGQESVTIVGGRPMHRSVAVEELPQGVEQVLTLAALDHRFRVEVGRDPLAAAASKGIRLDPVEAALLAAAPPAQLAAMAERLVVPRGIGRRHFVEAVSASVVALVTGKAMLLCSGCTGADTSWGVPDGNAPVQQWMNLAGHVCYVYVPAAVAAAHTPAPLLVALHGADETCLASVQRWRTAADSFGFDLLAVNWTEDAPTPETWDALVADLPAIASAFATTYPIEGELRYLSSRGASTALAWRAGYLAAGGFQAAALLGGVPDGDWVGDASPLVAAMVATPALYYVLGAADPDHAAGSAFYTAVTGAGVVGHLDALAGSTADAVLDFSAIWQWLRRPS
jgi:hypothetical protein